MKNTKDIRVVDIEPKVKEAFKKACGADGMNAVLKRFISLFAEDPLFMSRYMDAIDLRRKL